LLTRCFSLHGQQQPSMSPQDHETRPR
jgi:hypothetical protein